MLRTLTQFYAIVKIVLFCRTYETLLQHIRDSLGCMGRKGNGGEREGRVGEGKEGRGGEEGERKKGGEEKRKGGQGVASWLLGGGRPWL